MTDTTEGKKMSQFITLSEEERCNEGCCTQKKYMLNVPPKLIQPGRSTKTGQVLPVEALRATITTYGYHGEGTLKFADTYVSGFIPKTQQSDGNMVYYVQRELTLDELLWTLYGISDTPEEGENND